MLFILIASKTPEEISRVEETIIATPFEPNKAENMSFKTEKNTVKPQISSVVLVLVCTDDVIIVSIEAFLE